MEITKITTRLQLVSGREMALRLPQKAVMRMEIPAEAIMATTEGTQDSLEHSHVPVFEVELREQGYDDTGWKDAAQGCHGCPRNPGNLDADKGGGIHCDRSRRHL